MQLSDEGHTMSVSKKVKKTGKEVGKVAITAGEAALKTVAVIVAAALVAKVGPKEGGTKAP